MAIDVFDYRLDIRNLVITPEIRARFMRLDPGAVASRHSHDLGQEIFLVLEGRCEFEIEGERAVLGPGQLCVARTDQRHQVRTVGDEPMTMYLSVTPHIEPTHTFWDEGGEKLPPRYGVATEGERAARRQSFDSLPDLDDLAGRHLAAVRALAEAAAANARMQETATSALTVATERGDAQATKAAIDAMWDGLFDMFRRMQAVASAWNDLAPASVERETPR